MQAAPAVGVLTPREFSQQYLRLTEMVCCSGGGFSSTCCASRHEKPRLIAKWARSYHEPDPAPTCGLLGLRPATVAISQLRISGTAAHLPGGLVQQGCKCHGSLRVVSNWSHFWSAQHIRMCFGEPSQVPLWACYWYGKPD